MGGENVEADGILFVGRIDQDHIADALTGDAAQDLIDEVAMRVEHGQPLAVFDVLADEVIQKRTLACAMHANDVHVAHALVGGEADREGLLGMEVGSKQYAFGSPGNCRRGLRFARLPL